ncbi:MAG: hypothetical protein GXX94_03235 [Chloroflexi bacterium]|nr:hypothetical protein [Chloroflexota bacterium]
MSCVSILFVPGTWRYRRETERPTQITWYIGLALAVLSLVSILFTIPGITDTILLGLVPFAGLVLMLIESITAKV